MIVPSLPGYVNSINIKILYQVGSTLWRGQYLFIHKLLKTLEEKGNIIKYMCIDIKPRQQSGSSAVMGIFFVGRKLLSAFL